MRLIDADRVLLNKDERILGYTDINAALKLQMMKIVNAPTVDAIPVEWLKVQIEKCREISNTSKTVGLAILAETIKQWEKENGTEAD